MTPNEIDPNHPNDLPARLREPVAVCTTWGKRKGEWNTRPYTEKDRIAHEDLVVKLAAYHREKEKGWHRPQEEGSEDAQPKKRRQKRT